MTIFSISDAVAGEQDGFIELYVDLDAPAASTVTIRFNSSSGSATSNDIDQASGTITFLPGETRQTIRIAIRNDAIAEPTESFFVELFSPSSGSIGREVGTGTIYDNDGPAGPPILQVRDVVVDEITREARFVVTLDRVSITTVSSDYQTQNGTATAGADYVATTGALVFAPGETVKTIAVPLINDLTAEDTEAFGLLFSGTVGATTRDLSASAFIAANDAQTVQTPVISVDDVVMGEGDGYADFTVRLSAPSATPVGVSYTTSSGSATSNDVVSVSGILQFAAGETVKTVRVAITNDTLIEPTESFSVELFNPTGGIIGRDIGTGAIFDNDGPAGTPILQIRDVVVDEAAGETRFVVTLDRVSNTAISLDYQTRNGTATAGADYTAMAGALTFAPGETVKTIAVPLVNDLTTEDTETFDLLLSAIAGAMTRDLSASAFIAANDAQTVQTPIISIDDVVIGESDGYADFTVRLSAPSAAPVGVSYTTSSGSAGSNDIGTFSGVLRFAPGETVKTVRVAITGDTLAEATESFFIELFNSTGGTIGRIIGTGTIIDNDGPAGAPVLQVRDLVVDEAAREARFVVTLDRISNTAVSLDYQTRNGTATAGADYVAMMGALTFAPGETVKTVAVPLLDDMIAEDTEIFDLLFSALSGATTSDLATSAFIAANDTQTVQTPVISIDDVVIGEADGYADFTVRLSAPSAAPVGVNYTTATGSAGSNDIETFSGVVRFAPGETVKTVRVEIYGETLAEPTESFFVELFNATGGTIGRQIGTGTIIDNDGPAGTPVVAISDLVLNESAREAVFVVTLDRPSNAALTLDYATVEGGAVAGLDYVATSGTLTFAPGETTRLIRVAILEDAVAEGLEAFSVVLSNLSSGTTDDVVGTAVIVANDTPVVQTPVVSVANAIVLEDADFVDVLVTLSAPSAQRVSVAITANGQSANSNDFSMPGRTVAFAPGETLQIVRIPIVDDVGVESTESFTVELFSPSGVTIGSSIATISIFDDDTTPRAFPTTISGSAASDALFGSARAETINGGDNADYIHSGGGDDLLSGGAGADIFAFGAVGQGNDRITDFATALDRLELGSRGFSAVTTVGAYSVLTHAGGTVRVDGVTGLTLEQWNALVINAQVAPPPPLPPTTPQFFQLVPAGAAATVQGTGTVFGANGSTQQVTVRDLPGTITFDGTFNTGGDRIILAGNASNYTVARAGAAVTISDGDTRIVVPVGLGGADIVFGDGVRSLSLDTTAGVVRLGNQTVGSSAAAITAPAGPPIATGVTSDTLGSSLLVQPGAIATANGRLGVFGTRVAQETVVVAPSAVVAFDGSFNSGGDIIQVTGNASNWLASRSGATALLTGPAGESLSIPVGPNPIIVRFDGSDRLLMLDLQAGTVMLGGLALGSTPVPAGPPPAGTNAAIGEFDMAVVPLDFGTFVL